jgi:hypothetical protein
MNLFLVLLSLVFISCGVALVYDARNISLTKFKFGDVNDLTMGLKIFGYIVSILGLVILYVQVR